MAIEAIARNNLKQDIDLSDNLGATTSIGCLLAQRPNQDSEKEGQVM